MLLVMTKSEKKAKAISNKKADKVPNKTSSKAPALRLELLKQLSNLNGIAGQEDAVRQFVLDQLTGLVDEIRTDAMGNIIALRAAKSGKKAISSTSNDNGDASNCQLYQSSTKTDSPERVMISAHMDEIGFIVSSIDDKGFLRMQQLGGFDTRNLFARLVTVHTDTGELTGILNAAGRPVHVASPEERRKVPEVREFMVDLGLPAEEVKERVRLGDMITLQQSAVEVGQLICGKALDDRACVFMLLELLARFKKKRPKHDIYAVFSVQEEIGLRGAITAAYQVEPTIGIGLDVTLAVDTAGVKSVDQITKIGDGIGIKVYDSSMVSTRWLVREFEDLGAAEHIPTQLEILPLGGTDGGAIQRSRSGVPTLTLSIPTRYIHTVVEALHPDDVRAGVDLLEAYLG